MISTFAITLINLTDSQTIDCEQKARLLYDQRLTIRIAHAKLRRGSRPSRRLDGESAQLTRVLSQPAQPPSPSRFTEWNALPGWPSTFGVTGPVC